MLTTKPNEFTDETASKKQKPMIQSIQQTNRLELRIVAQL